jgi:hypothetical protein
MSETDLLAKVQRAICDEMPMDIGFYYCKQAARAAIAVIAQECAKLAEEIAYEYLKEWRAGFKSDSHLEGKSDGADEVADAIRQRFKING